MLKCIKLQRSPDHDLRGPTFKEKERRGRGKEREGKR